MLNQLVYLQRALAIAPEQQLLHRRRRRLLRVEVRGGGERPRAPALVSA